jgi:hypothetical protein
MTTIAEDAKEYEKPKLMTVADLPEINTDWDVQIDTEAQYPYRFVVVNNVRYKLPEPVRAAIKKIQLVNPAAKRFKVEAEGAGKKTSYTVIQL